MDGTRRPQGWRRRNRLDLVEQGADSPYERVRRIALVEQTQSLVDLVLVEIAGRCLLQQIERVGERLAPCQLLPRDENPHSKPDEHERDIDQRERRVEEVVVVARHELPDLVDEETKADTADDGCDPSRRPCDQRHADDQRNSEECSTPEEMRNVESVATELRVTRQDQEEPDDQDREDAYDEEGLDERLCGDRAHRRAEEPVDVPHLQVVCRTLRGVRRRVDHVRPGHRLLRS